jgi:orotidine-5'-phosphate decarboxylase
MTGSVASRVRFEAQRAKDHLIVALDVADLSEAQALVEQFGDEISLYKVGPRLFENGLVNFIESLVEREKRVFLDFKTVDIGETMRGMIDRISRLGVEFVTVMGAASTVSAARAGRANRHKPKILLVTLLTDYSEAAMQREFNTKKTVEQFVAERAGIAASAGADGVICSPKEITAVRRAVSQKEFLIVTPGIRPAGSRLDDQARTATPATAIASGADYLVVGRPITKAGDRSDDQLKAARGILLEMQEALDARSG